MQGQSSTQETMHVSKTIKNKTNYIFLFFVKEKEVCASQGLELNKIKEMM